MVSHTAIPNASTSAPQRIEIITGHEKRRRFTDEDKVRLVAEASLPGKSIALVARRHGICPSLLYRWRRAGDWGAGRVRPAPQLIPVHLAAAATAPDVPPSPDRVAGVVEITLPNGCSVRVDQYVDDRALRRILSAVRG
ncbi:MAG: transposase [Proteobacteria bacterium]|nr:transposase [Pseudomonadota bacterium]